MKEDEAVTHGCSRKGPWTMSSSRAVHEALSLDFLAHEGLASLFTIWQTLTAKDLNRRCGPACRVVWEGLSRKADPYPDLVRRFQREIVMILRPTGQMSPQ